MRSKSYIVLWNFLIMVTLNTITVFGQNSGNGKLNGVVQIDTS